MRKWTKRIGIATVAVATLCYFAVLPWLVARIDRQMNPVIGTAAGSPSNTAVTDATRRLHASLRVADLHGDALLWRRDLLQRNQHGHIDLPRLRDGGYALQVFASVTKSPRGLNYAQNSAESLDQITLLAVAQRWPWSTWTSLSERALFHAGRLHEFAAQSDDLVVVTKRSELEQALNSNQVAAILATEGAHPLEGELATLDRLIGAGYRVVGLQHFFDNALGGSLHGVSKAGLTEFGRQVIAALAEEAIIIDLAHSSEAVVRDVLAIHRQPVIVSHTGIKSVCDTPRNIRDELLHEIARNGGLIGIGFWDGAICDPTPNGIAKVIVAGIERFGVDAIALGSDFDGTVGTPFDAGGVIQLTQALVDAGLSEAQIQQVMGENAIDFFLRNLPQ